MAAAPKVKAVSAKASVQSKAKAKPQGLQLSAAQWKTYNKAYNATATAKYNAIAQRAAATRFRKYRLQAANATIAKYKATQRAARAAAIAANATKMSVQQSRAGHQNANLQNRVYNDFYTHMNLAGRLQYIQGGERAYAHKAVMRTVDQAQAMSYEAKIFNAASRAAKAAGKKAKPIKATSPITSTQKAQIAAASTKAAVKAVKAAKVRTASLPSDVKPPWNYDQWIDLKHTPACVPVAIANHLLFRTGQLMDDTFLMRFIEQCGNAPTIEDGLKALTEMHKRLDSNYKYAINAYEPVPVKFARSTGLVVGYASTYGDHAALSLGYGRVISWGAEIPEDAEMEEAWMIDWLAEMF